MVNYSKPEIEELEEIVTLDMGNGVRNFRTPNYHGQIGNLSIMLLIYTGATHSFIHPHIVQKLNLPFIPTTTLLVRSASGEKLVTSNTCQNVHFNIQKHTFCTDFRILEVQGYDLIHGVDWIASLGDMMTNLLKGVFVVEYKENEVKLLNEKNDSELRVHEGDVNVQKEHKEWHQIYLAYQYKIENEGLRTVVETDPKLQKILTQFQVVFDEPKHLPPKRLVDYKINLIPDAKPVNLRPYRMSHHQKGEVEKIV